MAELSRAVKMRRPDAVTEKPDIFHHPDQWHVWYMPHRPEIVLRDVTGRRNPNGGNRWIVLPCNHWPCQAQRLVRVGAILDVARATP